MKLASRAAATVAIAAVTTARLLAHDPGLSSLDVRIEPHEMIAALSLAAGDTRIIGDNEAVATLARDSIEVVQDGRRLPSSATSVWSDENGGVHVRISYDRTYGRQLVVRSAIASHLARGHRELLSIRAEDGTVLSERMLDGMLSETSSDISVISGRPGSLFARFLLLGVEHILTGYDHLLFLAGVLVVLRRWRDVVGTITAFTLSHSITLVLATTGLLLIPGRVVEPLIAASIVYVGIENLTRQVPASRWKLTFGFGLVHGLGFATVLRDLGVGADGRGAIALPLVSFNAGVEAGQMLVASLLVPIFWWLNARSTFRIRFAAAWSLLVIVAGGYWFVERIG
jgi:hydrogenase/urease accessory protein HupE